MGYSRKPELSADTPLGPMTAHFNSGTVIVFNQTYEQRLTINRVEYHTRFHAELINGAWQIGTYLEHGRPRSSMSIDRWHSCKCFDYTDAALNKATTVISAWLPGWVAAHAAEVAEAGRIAAEEARECAMAKVDRLRLEIAAAEEQIAAAIAHAATLQEAA